MTGMLFDIGQPEKPAQNPTPEIANKPFRHSSVDSKKTPIESLASYIGGSNYWCSYYSQQFTKSEELKPFDPLQLNIYQQYHKINDFIIKLQGPLTGSDDSGSTGRFTLTGRAIIPPLPELIPNFGDALIADIGEGRAGQFTVTSVRKLTHNLAAAWEIEFSLERIADQHITNLLDSKISKESWYQKDYLIGGSKALLTTEEYNAGRNLEEWFRVISRQIVTNNYSQQTRTLTIPLQEEITYDPFVMSAMNRLVTEREVPIWRHVTLFNCDDYRIANYSDVYDAVINRDPTAMFTVFKNFRGLRVKSQFTLAYQNPIRLSGVKRVVVPYVETMDNDNYTGLNELIGKHTNPLMPGIIAGESGNDGTVFGLDSCGCSNKHNPYLQAQQSLIDQELDDIAGMQIPKITNDSHALSPFFYSKELTKCTRFERDIWDSLDDKPVNREHIYEYCKMFPKWGRLEQYYLGPFLLVLIKYAIAGI